MFDYDARAVQIADQFTVSNVLGIGDFGRPSTREQQELLRGTFEACVRLRAQKFAESVIPNRQGPGLIVQRQTGDEWEEVEQDHPWLQIIRKPNQYRSAYDYWRWVSLARDLQGRAPQLVQDGPRGLPEQLLEMFTEFGKVQPLANKDGGISGYIYERADGRNIRLEERQIMELKRIDPHSPYETHSLLESLADEVAGDKFATEYRREAFESGRPPMVSLQTDQNLSPSQAQEHGEKFKKRFMDSRGNVKGIPVLPGGLELTDISIDPESFQMLEAQGLDQKVIFRTCGVPQALLDMDSNRAESHEARVHFMGTTIQNLLTGAASQLTEGLRQAFEPEGQLRVISPNVTLEDEQAQAEVDRSRLERGVPPAEIMRDRGEDVPEEFADQLEQPFIPQTLIPVGQRPLGGGRSDAKPFAPLPENGEDEEEQHTNGKATVGDFL